jgi:hypothetical protein
MFNTIDDAKNAEGNENKQNPFIDIVIDRYQKIRY